MLSQYKNLNEILKSNQSIHGTRIPENLESQFQSAQDSLIIYNTDIYNYFDSSRVELHIYSDDTWITGNHNIPFTPHSTNNIRDTKTNELIQFNVSPITIDLYNELSKLKINAGKFRFVTNFYRNLIGSFEKQYLILDEISPDRTELRLRFNYSDSDQIAKHQIVDYIKNVKQTSTTVNGNVNTLKTYLINFSKNQNFLYINSVIVDNFLYVKLLDPLPDEYEVAFKCWVVEELRPAYIDHFSIESYVETKTYKSLASPNWYANPNYNTSTETGLKNWNDLLGSSIQTSQQILDSYFSGSLSGMKLNIDYSDFNNFIFYSSATERLKNFKYKLELIEYYNTQNSIISGLSGSIATTNAADYNLRITNLISGFDAFEYHLYYGTGSRITTHDIPVINAPVLGLTGSYITPIPKQSNNSYSYYGTASYGTSSYSVITSTLTNVSVTSSQFANWYVPLIETASLYDSLNYNALRYGVPEFIRLSQESENLELFVNMLGHHFDILYMYINHMSKIHKREENPKFGMPNELLYSVAKQFGWNLTNGNQYQELWSYLFGSDESGTPLTGSNSVNGTSLSGQDMTYTVWRRIVNNLPLLLKSKGSKRSVQALLSCYGIPQSIITIKEYGGPRIDRPPVYEKLNFDYSLDLINNTTGTVAVNYSQSINSVELRFRTDNVVKNPALPNIMNLYTLGSNTVTLDYSNGTLGTIQINGTSSANIEMFDGGWINTVLRTSGNKLQVVAKRSKYGKIVAAVSASATASFELSGSLVIGGSTGGSRLFGQVQELRLWSTSLGDSAFNNHTKAPAAYDGNVDAYDELVFRLPLTQKINHTTSTSLLGDQPVASAMSASFSGWTTAEPYDSIEEMYYYDGISLGAGSFDDNKVRIEENELVGTLNVKTRAELSQYDKAPLDSNKLGIYFSPQTMINEDIIAQLGFTSLDDYIGDPGEKERKSYPKLIEKAHDYWKKYTDKNDINAYIKIFTLFDLSFFHQLEQLLPARTHQTTGVLIQPNILERSKDTLLPSLYRYNDTYETTIQDIQPTASGQYDKYEVVLADIYPTPQFEYTEYSAKLDSNDIIQINGYDDEQLVAYLTSSAEKRYGGTKYKHDYLYRSGSTFITGSTPYWQSEGVYPVITTAPNSHRRYKGSFTTSAIGYLYGSAIYGTSLYAVYSISWKTGSLAQLQDYLPTGLYNLWYDGCKITSRGFNIPSSDTVDGGPVVEWSNTTGNQLIYQNTGQQGSFRVSTGVASNGNTNT